MRTLLFRNGKTCELKKIYSNSNMNTSDYSILKSILKKQDRMPTLLYKNGKICVFIENHSNNSNRDTSDSSILKSIMKKQDRMPTLLFRNGQIYKLKKIHSNKDTSNSSTLKSILEKQDRIPTLLFRNGQIYKLKKIHKNNRRTDTSVYSILKTILEKQNRAEAQKEIEANFLAPNDLEGDTIPILLYSSVSSKPLFVYGNIGDCFPDVNGVFKTSFFRIEQIINSSYIFSLMRPLNEDGQIASSIRNTYRLEKTDLRIEMHSEEISFIQCASPKLVNRKLIMIEQKF